MLETAFDKVTAALTSNGSIHRGNNWRCPAHEDNKAS